MDTHRRGRPRAPAAGRDQRDGPGFAFTASTRRRGRRDRLPARPRVRTRVHQPATRADLVDGLHTFSVRARDVAGNLRPRRQHGAGGSTPFRPTPRSAGARPRTPPRRLRATVAGSDPGGAGDASVQCSLDGAAYADCPAPATYAGWRGPHALAARAVDGAGNVDASRPSGQGTSTDRTEARVASGPGDPHRGHGGDFSFAADSAGAAANARSECRLDGAAYATCGRPIVFGGLESEHDNGSTSAPSTSWATSRRRRRRSPGRSRTCRSPPTTVRRRSGAAGRGQRPGQRRRAARAAR